MFGSSITNYNSCFSSEGKLFYIICNAILLTMSVGLFIYYYGACNTDGEYIKDTAYLVDESQHLCSLYNVFFNTTRQSLNISTMQCTEPSSDNALTDCSDMPVSRDATAPLCVYGVRSNEDMLWTIECHSTIFCHSSEFNSM